MNLKDGDGRTALVQAIDDAYFEEAQMLVDAGAILDIADDRRNTPLIHAVKMGRKEIFDLLVNRKADVHKKNDLGRTALIEGALDLYRTYYLPRLLKAGANYEEAKVYIEQMNLDHTYKKAALKRLKEAKKIASDLNVSV